MKDKSTSNPKGAKKGRPKGIKSKKAQKKAIPLHSPMDFDGGVTPKGAIAAAPIKRGPGRPPKSQYVIKNTEVKRARPNPTSQRNMSKALSTGESTIVVQKGVKRRISERDHPTKLSESSIDEKMSGGPMFNSSGMLPFQNQRSRSGRILKRNTVYDQMTEGEQHLKTVTRKMVESSRPNAKASEMNESQTKIPRGTRKQLDEGHNDTDDQQLTTVSRIVEANADEIKKATEAAIAAVNGGLKRVPETTSISAPSQDVADNLKVETTNVGTMVGRTNIPSPKTTELRQAEMHSSLNTTAPVTSSLSSSLPHSELNPQNHYTGKGQNLQPAISLDPKRTAHEPVTVPPTTIVTSTTPAHTKVPRRKPGARECMQMSRKFGNQIISQHSMEVLLDYCSRGKVEHLIKMRERLDEHSRYLESELAGLETLIQERGEYNDGIVPDINNHVVAMKETKSSETQNPHTVQNKST